MVSTHSDDVDAKILHGAPVAMALVEGPEHVLQDVNDAFCSLVGKDRDALLGCSFSSLVSPDGEEQECIAFLDRIYRTGASETLANDPHPHPTNDEPAYWSYSAWAVPSSTDSDEQETGRVVVQVTDTTTDHTFRQMVSRMNQELIVTTVRMSEQAETMADAEKAKNRFLAVLAHEIRNPLSAIGNAAALLEMRTADQEKVQQPVKIIIRQVRHTARLVEDLMDVSRITHGKIELKRRLTNVSAAVHRAAEVAQPLMADVGCDFSLSLPTQPIWVDGDSARLEQILDNLLSNAAKYTDRGGKVTLALRRDEEDVLIEVRDTGVGIAPEMLPLIFDLFVQEDRSLSRARGGLGIGLTLVRTLAELHGGTVTAESAGLGQGSAFTVRLPAAEEGATTVSTEVGSSEATPQALDILLVDDNVLAVLPLADILEIWGNRVRVVYDGPSAIEAAKAEVPDVVLLDLGLPGMDGYEVARTMRAMPAMKRVRIIALTGYGSKLDHSLTREAGFNEHLVKPVDLPALKNLLAGFGSESR